MSVKIRLESDYEILAEFLRDVKEIVINMGFHSQARNCSI